MSKYPVYFIVGLIFLGIAKLLQVTAFDAKKYGANKESSFSEVFTQKDEKSSSRVDKKSSLIENPAEEKQPTDTLKSKDGDYYQNFEEIEESESAEVSDPAYNSLSDLKNNYLLPKIAQLPDGQLREDVVLRYYKHEKDGDRIYELRDFGYYIHEKEVNETEGLGSNVLYYGEDVNLEDIQIVALKLLQSGIPIKSIEPSSFDWKSNAIEIGTDTLLLDDPNLTNQDVINFKKSK